MADNTLNVIVKLTDQASGGLKSFADNVDKTGKSIEDTTGKAQTFTKVVTAVGLAVGTYALANFSEFEKTMSGVKAVLSPTGDEFAALGDKVKQLGKDTTFTQAEIARTTEDLAKNGLNAAQILGGALDATANFAAAAGTNLETAGNVMSDAMNIFGLSADQATKAVDQMTGVTIASKFGAEDLSLALAQGGGVAKAVGVSFEDFNTTIAATSNSFASGSDAGTSFKTFLQRLSPTTEKAAALMADIGFSAYDATGALLPMREIAQRLQVSLKGMSDEQKNMTLTTLFGSDSMRIAAAVAEQGAEGFDKYSQAIGKVDAAAQAATRLDNFSGSLEKLKGTIDVIANALGEKIAKVLRPAIDGLANALEDLGKWFNSLSPEMQTFLEYAATGVAVIAGFVFAVGAIGIVISPVLLAVSTLAGAFSFLFGAVSLVTGAFTALVTVVGWPVLLVIAAVALAIGLLYLAWTNNFLGIQDITKTVVDAVVGFFTQLGADMANIWTSITTNVSAAWDAITGFISAAWEGIKTVFTTVAKVLFAVVLVLLDGILQLFGTNLAAVLVTITTVWDSIKEATSIFAEFVTTAIGSFWNFIKNAFTTGASFVQTGFSAFTELLGNVARVGSDMLTLIFGGLWDSVTNLFKSGAEIAGGLWDAFSGSIVNSMRVAWDGVKGIISGGINWIIEKANAVIDSINAVSDKVGFTVGRIQPVAFQTGGIVPGFGAAFQTGGVVPGGKNPASHDKVMTALDPGELILNRAQQNNLAGQIMASETPQQTVASAPTSINLTIEMGGVNVYNEADEDRLMQNMKKTLIRELQVYSRFGIS